MPITAKTTGNTIFADDYNKLQEKVKSILGAGGGIYGNDYGYGQTVKSSQVIGATSPNNNTGDLVTVEQMNDLRMDIMTCWQHQTTDIFPINSVTSIDTVSAGDTSAPLLGQDNKTYNDYIFCVNYIDTNRLTASPTAMSLISGKAELGFTNWNNFKTHDVTVTFLDSSHKRYFFNAGGEIRISAVHAGSFIVNSKAWSWQQLLANAGVLTYKYTDNVAISSAPTVLLNKTATNSVVYAENYYKILGSAPASNTLFFRIIFHDVDVGDRVGAGAPVDENVSGTTTSSISLYYPTGTVQDPEDSQYYEGVKLEQPTITSLQGTVY
jgi:hypothetical protein